MNKVEGLISFYKLREWWFSSFTEGERLYIDNRFVPMGLHALTKGKISNLNQPVPEFLNSLLTWFSSSEDSSIAERIHKKLSEITQEHPIIKPGYYNGRHFTTYVTDIKNLKKIGNLEEAERILLELVKATESDSLFNGWGVAPWYYEELAKIYRKQMNLSKEISILERFSKQKHAPGVKPQKLLERLKKAKELFSK